MDLSDQVKMETELPNSGVKQLPEGQLVPQPARGNDLSARLRTLEFKMRQLQEMQENMQKVQQWLSSQRGELNRQHQQLKQQQLMQRQGLDKENPADVKVQRPRGCRGGKNKRSRDHVNPYKRKLTVVAEYLAKQAVDAAMGSAVTVVEAISKQAEGRQR